MNPSGKTTAGQLDCLVEITWPAGRSPWWSVSHTGHPSQIAAALDELALRIGIDHWTRVLSALDRPIVGCSLTVQWSDTDHVAHAADVVTIGAIPALLRAHATAIRSYPR
ncbi:hypothetical protein ACFQZZ_00175 [Nocardia sp. GCM10030253]|uniref:hypothetical protein n=1 Tax=Nocardia sp. GCM10030253 TaxID=3273404 RepID=UPI003629E4DC